MNWLFFALLAPAIYTIVNFIDKYIIEVKVKDYRGMPIFGAITGFFVGTLFWIITGRPLLPPKDALLIMLAGMFTIWGAAFYFKALAKEETSKIIIFFQLSPLLVLLFSSIFLKESLSVKQLVGFAFILTSTISLSINRDVKGMRISESFWLIMIVDVLWALAAIFAKLTIESASFSSILSYESWGIGIGGLILFILFKHIRMSFKQIVFSVGKIALVIMFINEFIFVTAKTITFYAYSLGPTAIVSVIGNTNIFFGILYGAILTMIAPKIFKEGLTRKDIFQKVLAAIILFIGIICIY